MIDGSFAKWSDKQLILQPQKAASYEWKENQDNAASSKNPSEKLVIRGPLG
jgi:hypothetical protein